jgi:hypothetical protein
MSTGALTMMLITEISVVIITAFFFYKVLTTKKHSEPDSFTENDDEK